MALARHWKKVAAGIGLYFAGLVGYQQYQMAQRDPQQAILSEQRRADEWKRWDEAKEAGQPRTAPHSTPRPLPYQPPSKRASDAPPSLCLCSRLPLPVRKECLALSVVSLDCQHRYQVLGVDRDTSMAQCASSIESYKECVRRKADVDSRRRWMESKRKESTMQQRPGGVNT